MCVCLCVCLPVCVYLFDVYTCRHEYMNINNTIL